MSRIQADPLEAAMAQYAAAYDAEYSKGDNSNHQRLHDLACRYFALLMRQSNRCDQHHIQDLRERINEDVKKIQETHNKTRSVFITVISSALSIAFGVAGVAGAFMGAKDIMNVAQFGGALGSGIGGVGKVFDDSAARDRTGHQHALDERKRVRDNDDGTMRQNDGRVKDAISASREVANAAHQAFQDAGR
jgi:hypothetical protein